MLNNNYMIARYSSDSSDVVRAFILVTFIGFIGFLNYVLAVNKSNKQESLDVTNKKAEAVDKDEDLIESFQNTLKSKGIEKLQIKNVYPISKNDNLERFSLEIDEVSSDDNKVDTIDRLHVEVKKSVSGKQEITKIILPKRLHNESSNTLGLNDKSIEILYEDDVFYVADYFITALSELNYESAISYCLSGGALAEQIAGLCIMIEGARFKTSEEKPFEIVEANSNLVTLRIHLDSIDDRKSFHFKVRLERQTSKDYDSWKINRIYLNEAFTSYFSPEDTSVPYVPIRTDLGSGDCVVIYFDFKSSDLHPRAQKQLQILTDVLREMAAKAVKIHGHADEIGTDKYNLNLSLERAENVRNLLISGGIKPRNISILGKGESEEWLPNRLANGNDNPIGRSYNRRVEIWLD